MMNRYPSIDDLRQRAQRRMPHFAWEYLDSGTGVEDCILRNRAAFAEITLTPEFMQGVFEPDISTTLFGVPYNAPFGIAPVGLTGLMWPRAEHILARTAAQYHIPYSLSTVATAEPEVIGPLANGMAWFQLYPPRNSDIRRDLLARARDSGFTTLLVTVDVPVGSRRERQVRAGVSVPPKTTLRTLYHCSLRPAWTWATLVAGQPRFRGLEKYLAGREMQQMAAFIGKEFGGSLDWEYLQAVREEWDGPILLKGLLDVDQAERAAALGLEGIVVSNHGGRQFDGAPAALSVLPAIAAAVGDRLKIVFDSGVRTGLDVVRALALGADFVLLGRAFMYGVAAFGDKGGAHVADILIDDLKNNMTQLGCANLQTITDRWQKTGNQKPIELAIHNQQ